MARENSADWLIYGVLLVVLAAPLYFGIMRAADVYYKTGWMVAHWNDASEFPPGSDLCMYNFCTRTDTREKHVGGRPGYTSEVKYYYCPIHEPTFVHTDSRIDGFLYFVYWIWAIICSGIPLFLVILPFTFIADKLGKRSASWQRLEEVSANIVGIGVVIILGVVWVMFAWW